MIIELDALSGALNIIRIPNESPMTFTAYKFSILVNSRFVALAAPAFPNRGIQELSPQDVNESESEEEREDYEKSDHDAHMSRVVLKHVQPSGHSSPKLS